MKKYDSVKPLICAAAFLAGFMSPYYAAIILILAFMADMPYACKKASANSFVLYTLIMMISKVIGYLSSWFMDFCDLFSGQEIYGILTKFNVFGYINTFLSFCSVVIMLILVGACLLGKTPKVFVIDKITSKFVKNAEEEEGNKILENEKFEQ